MRISVPDEHALEPIGYVAQTYKPSLVQAAYQYSTATYVETGLTLREFEAARSRTAQINGCLLCQTWRTDRDTSAFLEAVGSGGRESVATRGGPAPDEAFYDAIADWDNATIFSERERIAIEYAEGLGLDPHAIAQNEEFWRRAKSVFSDEELGDLSYCLACWIGLGRITHALGIDGVCQIPSQTKDVGEQRAA